MLCGIKKYKGGAFVMPSQFALAYVRGSHGCTTTDIENHVMSFGFSQNQVLGAIGYLRSKGLISILGQYLNPISGRKEHKFR